MFKNIWNEYRAAQQQTAQRINEATKKYGRELSQEDIEHLCESKYHVCAVVVEHPIWGEGKPLMGQHAEPDDEGNVAWYDVEFAHGVEKKVHVDGLNILDESSHGSKKKSKSEGNAFNAALIAAREKGEKTFTVAGKQYDVKTEMAKMGMSTEDIDHLCNSKYHVCAVVVEHPKWGVGKPLMGRHAEPDDEGNVAWYDVEFAHGIEEKVYADNFNIVDEGSHGKKMNASKKPATEKLSSKEKMKRGMYQKNDNTNDQEDDGEGLDKVQPKALKKKFKDRKDKDIDNDGDVDSSDEYLHTRRKATSKAIAKGKNGNGNGDDVKMNPKMESRIRKTLRDVLEANQSPNKDKAEKPEDALKGKGAKDMMNQPKDTNDTQAMGHDDASKAGKVTKAAAARNGGDAVRSGDQGVRNPIKKTMEAYVNMQKKNLLLNETAGKMGADQTYGQPAEYDPDHRTTKHYEKVIMPYLQKMSRKYKINHSFGGNDFQGKRHPKPDITMHYSGDAEGDFDAHSYTVHKDGAAANDAKLHAKVMHNFKG